MLGQLKKKKATESQHSREHVTSGVPDHLVDANLGETSVMLPERSAEPRTPSPIL